MFIDVWCQIYIKQKYNLQVNHDYNVGIFLLGIVFCNNTSISFVVRNE